LAPVKKQQTDRADEDIGDPRQALSTNSMDFVHLHVHTEFSLLDGAARHQVLLEKAKALGMSALAVTDHGLYGVIRFYQKALEAGIRPIIGCEITLEKEDGPHLTLLARSLKGYSSLCAMLTAANLTGARPWVELSCLDDEDDGQPSGDGPAHASEDASDDEADSIPVVHGQPLPVSWQNLAEHATDLIALSGCQQGEIPSLVAQGKQPEALAAARRYQEIFDQGRFYLELQNYRTGPSQATLRGMVTFGREANLPLVATNNVHYLEPLGYRLHEVLTAIRNLTTLEAQTGARGMEQYLKSPQQMARLFRECPQAISNTVRIAEECQVEMPLGKPQLPAFDLPPGETPFSMLYKLAFAGATSLFKPLRPDVSRRLQEELDIIQQLGLCDYFLLVWDIVQFARRSSIRCSGRGSGADSLVCYCLGITHVDPLACHLPFGRFLSLERKEMPDIDLDFDATRRDDVIRYVFQKYGTDRVAMVATVNTFRARGAVREASKVLGFTPGETTRLADRIPHIRADRLRQAMATLPELRDGWYAGSPPEALPAGPSDASPSPILQPEPAPKAEGDNLTMLWDVVESMHEMPTHLSVHVGGVIVGVRPLTEAMSLQQSAKGVIISCFDKDDVEALGFVKLDMLSLRTLASVQYAVQLIAQQHGRQVELERLPLDIPQVYDLIRSSNTVGIFQLESPGQRELQGRMQCKEYFDIVCAISLFRPGPVQGDMVEPFIRRHQGLEKVTYLHPALESILKVTFGVVLFQEQVLDVAHAVAGFTHGEADQLRRAMTHNRSADEMSKIEGLFVRKAVDKGVAAEVAARIFQQLRGFAAYGFCRAHAQSFALITYQTVWLKVFYPAEFFAGVLTHQPGMYPPRVFINEARRAGVGILPVDINRSSDRYTVEKGAIRLPLSQIAGMSAPTLRTILRQREAGGPFASLRDFCHRVRLERPILENLIRLSAFRGVESASAQSLLWEAPLLLKESGQPIQGMALASALPNKPTGHEDGEQLQAEHELLGFSLGKHVLGYLRPALQRQGAVRSAGLAKLAAGTKIAIAGQIVSWQTPPTRSGQRIIFVSMEDEDGLTQVVIFPRAQEKCVPAMHDSPLILVKGAVQRRGLRATIVAEEITALPMTAQSH
jgi:error-prone DNA polymerase